MDGEGGAFGVGVVITFALCTWLHECTMEQYKQRFANESCAVSCKRLGAGEAHSADHTYCTCTNGVALKRDRSRLYVRVVAKP